MTAPWRGPGPDRPAVPLPPERMPAWRGGRPLKRWTWVGAFGPDVMLCAASARVGPFASSWWAVWDGVSLSERTLRRALPVSGEHATVPGVLDLAIAGGAEIE